MFTDNSANKTAFPYIITETLDSTNSYLKSQAGVVSPWTTVRAITQEAGRGRFDRSWNSVPKQDATFSIIIPVAADKLAILPSLTPVIGISVREACEQMGVSAKIKWPNDILVDAKKLSGILVEVLSGSGEAWAIVGIGINCNSERESNRLFPAISLKEILGKGVDVDSVIQRVVERVQDNVAQFLREGFAPFRQVYNEHLAWCGDMRCIRDSGEKKYGIIQGVDANGALLFRHGESGVVEALTAGELDF